MYQLFEKLVHPYPTTVFATPPRHFLRFVWGCTEGLRGYILGMALCTAAIGAFEALLYAVLARVVDWLGGAAGPAG
ncbi:MAG: hypothetical protein CGU28_00820 [Candidatus Dactylopiibacterium carminicum]|uniref:Multidrug ABC transporter ATP-binding protein n=1 Tax=Candidatus Dactylopiibacterium carminicum TaxID=857335 RepID=A0A272EVU4_9RHOO|nr:hypothetical protein [Candidatus Dactylopiibacterium carminicum]KAF7597665.1 hypothetical protein BGI27_17565 [Candidatus Dactylopiibacterium carminicum]PAS93543.1 MAG: hypothetical protein BSR46_17615 [Candidatus Dactylopiibacterium carminicum]PAS94225.1 MAG: hypothetical protein CGU29_04160 [Candidatus Dactylopiibacterium carminicum]PAS98422.1 MAG: hypothetical protein CGU28_00820 [Candidatus Dactylopiibacterium carminicum]